MMQSIYINTPNSNYLIWASRAYNMAWLTQYVNIWNMESIMYQGKSRKNNLLHKENK